MKFFETSAYNSISKDYNPEKNFGAFNDKYIEYKIKNDDNDDNCFQYAVRVALNNENIENHPKISEVKPFIN